MHFLRFQSIENHYISSNNHIKIVDIVYRKFSFSEYWNNFHIFTVYTQFFHRSFTNRSSLVKKVRFFTSFLWKFGENWCALIVMFQKKVTMWKTFHRSFTVLSQRCILCAWTQHNSWNVSRLTSIFHNICQIVSFL